MTKRKPKQAKPKAELKTATTPDEMRELVTERVGFIIACMYGDDMPDPWLDWVPNDDDADPSMFYNCVRNSFPLAPTTSTYFEGLGGSIREMIDAVVARWLPPHEVDVVAPLDPGDPGH